MTIKPDPQATPPTPAAPPAPAPPEVRPTRFGGLWFTFALGAVVLVLLLVFVLMNGDRVQIHLYGAHFTAPLGVAILLAAALGVLLIVVPGAGRILQLKRAARRLHRERLQLADRLQEASVTAAPDPAPPAPPAPAEPAQSREDLPLN
ncbi:MAG TPA: lipopolysaccharide assembly protein LapA domain-containing protein [Actinospica sp.]|nr:lipopolysaccharide assembly protein LapA domain-containing protein [Actinospica sp.]